MPENVHNLLEMLKTIEEHDKVYNAHINAGFTREEALRILEAIGPTKLGS